MITLFQAIQSLAPGAEVSVSIYDQTIEWHNPPTAPVTLDQINQEQQRLQQAYDWDEYQRNRAREYPSVEEQLDALYHAGVFPPEMAARIRAVKEKYPRHARRPQQQTPQPVINTETSATVLVLQPENAPAPRMSVEEWLAHESKLTREQWLAQQQSARPMTREEWLASQAEVKTEKMSEKPVYTADRTVTTEEWLQEQTAQYSGQTLTREQWLAQQSNAKS